MMWLHGVLLTVAVFTTTTWAADKQIKLEDIERDNLKNSKDQGKPQQFQYQQQQAPAGPPGGQQFLQLTPAQQQLISQQLQQQQQQQQQYLFQPQVLAPGGQFAYYPSLPAFGGNQLQATYVSPEQAQALAAQYQQAQAVPQQAYLNAVQYVPAAVPSQARLQAEPPKYVQQGVPAQQFLQYVPQQQAAPQQQYFQQQLQNQVHGGSSLQQQLQNQVPSGSSLQQQLQNQVHGGSSLQQHVPPPLSSPPEAPEPTVQYSSGEVYSTIPYSSKQDYSIQLTNPPSPQQQQQFPPRAYNPYNALLHAQQQKTLFAAGAKSTMAPPIKALPQGGFLPNGSINHPGQGFSFSNYRRGPPSNF